MSAIVSFLSLERLDELIQATGFSSENMPADYKFEWLMERIAMLRERAAMADIVHDNPTVNDLVAIIQHERKWSAGLQQTIAYLQSELAAAQGKARK